MAARRLRRVWGGILAVTFAVLVVLAPPATAHSWGPYPGIAWQDNINWADNSTHTFCYESLTTTTTDAANYVRATALDGQTDMTTQLLSACTSLTDVRVRDGVYGQGWLGIYECQSRNSALECESALVRLDTDRVPPNAANRRHTLCHEFGHSVGLRHYPLSDPGTGNTAGCMASGLLTLTSYSPHERSAHINIRY